MHISLVYGEGFSGEWKEMAFFPDKQSYKIIDSRPISVIKLADDLSGIPRLLANSYIHFAPDYFTMRSINSGGEFVIDSCFKFVDSKLTAYPVGRSQRVMGEKIEFTLSGNLIEMTYSNAILLKLKKSPPPAREAELRSSYQALLTKTRQKHRSQDQDLSCEEYIMRLDLIENKITKDTSIEELVHLLKQIVVKNNNDDKNLNSTLRNMNMFTESGLTFDQFRQVFFEEVSNYVDCKSKYYLENYPDIAHKVLEREVKAKNINTYRHPSISTDDKLKIKAALKQAERECGGNKLFGKVRERVKVK